MPLSINFRWKTPSIQAPQTMWEKNRTGENITQAAQAIGQGLERKRQRDRQSRIDRMNEEDRQRRIDWEDRQRRTYGEAADYMRGRSAERDSLVKRAEQLRTEIAALRAQLGV